MVKPQILDRMARLEPKEERYYLEKDNLYLIGSAEHALGPLHMDQTIDENDFPIRYVGYSTSFRREAGSYGKDTKGIFRVHQFDKLEIESFTLPEESIKEQDFIVGLQIFDASDFLSISKEHLKINKWQFKARITPESIEIRLNCEVNIRNKIKELNPIIIQQNTENLPSSQMIVTA